MGNSEAVTDPAKLPVLSDGVVTLRAHRPTDALAIVELATDPLTVRLTTVPVPYPGQEAEAFLDRIAASWEEPEGNRSWAIEVTDVSGVPRFAGTIGYSPEGAGLAEVSFALHPWARGQGHMTRAVRLVVGYAFDHGGVEVVRWRAQVPNWASRRIAWAVGFRVEGTVTGLLKARGERHDGWIGSLRKGDPMTPAHPWHVAVVLPGDTVRLRPWRGEDRPRPDQVPDAASLRFMPRGSQPTPEDFDPWLTQRRSKMASGESITWCIADAGSDEPLGMLTCFRLDNPLTRGSAEVGYWLHEGARGRGGMREALELLIEHAFAQVQDGGLGLHRLAAGTDIDNRASELVLRRAGFARLGIEREAIAHVDEAPTDGPLWELLASTDRDAVRAAHLAPVVLNGAQVRLRPWRDSDAPRVVHACTDAGTRHYLRALPSPYTQADASAYLRRTWDAQWDGSTMYWCIADIDSDECVGSIAVMGMTGMNPLSAEIGYWLHPQGRGRGVMTEAVRLAAGHAFTAKLEGGLGRERLALLAAATNSASQAVARRCGFVEVGRDRRGEILGDGTVVDLVRFDLLRSDWLDSEGG